MLFPQGAMSFPAATDWVPRLPPSPVACPFPTTSAPGHPICDLSTVP